MAIAACSSSSSSSATTGGTDDGGATSDAARFAELAHRSPATCTPTPAQTNIDAGACDHVHECTVDTDCTASPNGHCDYIDVGPIADCGHYCMYDTCTSDSDCASDEACVCHDSGNCVDGPHHVPSCGVANSCVKADCRSDADCGSGACTAAVGTCGFVGYRCRASVDECVTDADCTSPRQCLFDGSHWACLTSAGCP
ncbi:MAG TPA: hypothetical protein VF407_01605 [Polyangiaceae bacterium]